MDELGRLACTLRDREEGTHAPGLALRLLQHGERWSGFGLGLGFGFGFGFGSGSGSGFGFGFGFGLGVRVACSSTVRVAPSKLSAISCAHAASAVGVA